MTTFGTAPAIETHGGVGVVERLEDDDLVPRLAEREQRRGDGLGRSGRDQHAVVGVERQAVVRPLVLGDGRPELGDARPRGVLVVAGPDRRDGRVGDAAGPSVSGNPCPRLIDPVAAASADISAKIVVVNGWSRVLRYGTRSVPVGDTPAGSRTRPMLPTTSAAPDLAVASGAPCPLHHRR